MNQVEKQVRDHAMRAQHSARRLREAAKMERQAGANLQAQLERYQLGIARHAALAAEHEKRASQKDDEQKQWEALLPAQSIAPAATEHRQWSVSEVAKAFSVPAEMLRGE